MTDYTGLFKSKGYGDVRIAKEGEELKARFRTVVCSLEHAGNEVFRIRHPVSREAWRTEFHSGRRGEIRSFNVQIHPMLKEINFEKTTAGRDDGPPDGDGNG